METVKFEILETNARTLQAMFKRMVLIQSFLQPIEKAALKDLREQLDTALLEK